MKKKNKISGKELKLFIDDKLVAKSLPVDVSHRFSGIDYIDLPAEDQEFLSIIGNRVYHESHGRFILSDATQVDDKIYLTFRTNPEADCSHTAMDMPVSLKFMDEIDRNIRLSFITKSVISGFIHHYNRNPSKVPPKRTDINIMLVCSECFDGGEELTMGKITDGVCNVCKKKIYVDTEGYHFIKKPNA